MFGAALESLLLKAKAGEIVGRGTTLKEAAPALRRLQPDLLIVDTDPGASAIVADLLRLVQTNPGLKLIHLSLQSNRLYLYQAAHTRVQTLADLIEAITEV